LVERLGSPDWAQVQQALDALDEHLLVHKRSVLDLADRIRHAPDAWGVLITSDNIENIYRPVR